MKFSNDGDTILITTTEGIIYLVDGESFCFLFL